MTAAARTPRLKRSSTPDVSWCGVEGFIRSRAKSRVGVAHTVRTLKVCWTRLRALPDTVARVLKTILSVEYEGLVESKFQS